MTWLIGYFGFHDVFRIVALIIHWLTKETQQTFFANGSNRNIEI